jgi:ABC-type sugar transport system ATPase subunit
LIEAAPAAHAVAEPRPGVGVREELLRVRGLSKTFPGLRALADVSLSVHAGEIVALVGQNGSGKSTLVKTLAGVHEPDPGAEIDVAGGRADGSGETELHFIHQDLGLIEGLSTVENLDLGRDHRWAGLLPSPRQTERTRAERLIAGFGAAFDVTAPVRDLSSAERAIVAIARALDGWSHPTNVLVLDEPTAALHGEEVEKLFDAVRRIAASGAGVVFISHRLDEVFDLADRVVVLRDGRVVADVGGERLDHDELIALITGIALPEPVERSRRAAEEVVLAARGVRGATIDGLDLDLCAGEIVGVSGVLGSGREQLAGILFGLAPGEAAEVRVGGRTLRRLSPRAAIALGVGYVPADRRAHGAVLSLSARENITLPRLAPFTRAGGRIDGGAERAEVRRWVELVDLRPPEPERTLGFLSGGNQQKVVLAKWLRNEPRVLLLDEPTQGVDVGAKAGILELIGAAAARGAGVLICSSDTKELATVCDRVLVLRDGRAVAEPAGPELSEARLVREGLGAAAGRGGAHA